MIWLLAIPGSQQLCCVLYGMKRSGQDCVAPGNTGFSAAMLCAIWNEEVRSGLCGSWQYRVLSSYAVCYMEWRDQVRTVWLLAIPGSQQLCCVLYGMKRSGQDCVAPGNTGFSAAMLCAIWNEEVRSGLCQTFDTCRPIDATLNVDSHERIAYIFDYG